MKYRTFFLNKNKNTRYKPNLGLGTVLLLSVLFLLPSCEDEVTPLDLEGDLTDIPYAPTPYELIIPDSFPAMTIPVDNPMTQEGFELGRRLFYDVKLSSDNSMSCASCHLPELNFTDAVDFSIGVQGLPTPRSSMSLANVGFFDNGLFWDGRTMTLEQQALEPIENELELFEDWDNVETKLREDDVYPRMFREAFGIDYVDEIDRTLATKAIAQFERALISGESKFDKFVLQRNFAYEFTDAETRGKAMYFEEGIPGLQDAQCIHCHDAPLFTVGDYFNNGLDSYPTLGDYTDKGRGAVTGNYYDNGKFKSPSLRNIELTAPYMHDGRFATLEEVIDHYNSGGHNADNLDVNMEPLNLTDQQKSDLIAFLKTLTDMSFVENPAFQNPF